MSQLPVTIPKQPLLTPAEDYYRLRREGIGFIEQMGSHLWTDYNTHDPGITILEALCYALTDLAYRTGWDIKDLLATATPSADPNSPFPHQPFFTAKDILTVNPWTPEDFRRLLIDLEMVRNAWVLCKACACDFYYYAWCEKNQLVLSYQKPTNPLLEPQKVQPLGLYEVLLALESDPELGDLNDRKIEHTYNVFDTDGHPHPVTMELRFPEWGLEKRDDWGLFLQSGASFNVQVSRFGATKTYDVLADPALDEAGRNKYLRDHWRTVFYASFAIELLPGGENLTIEHAALRMFGDTFAKSQTTVRGLQGLQILLADKTALGFLQRYRHKLCKVKQAVAEAKASLHDHRNLDEDYCRVKGVNVEEIAACADVEVTPDADIELVQAQIWFEIEHYFNPSVPFYTLQELMETGVPVEEIFNGPELKHGFIKAKELEVAELKTVLRTSDIVNRLMDIAGVVAVNNLLLSKYDAEGNVVKGAADPTWNNDTPVFDVNKMSASWLLFISALHQPRLYHNQSRFLFYKNGLPFRPRMDEAYDTLTQLRGEAERPKIKDAPRDLPIPEGTFRSPEEYSPVQYSFPSTYGIGLDGLPSHASPLRRAQARQMKAYLMIFEQLLGNAFSQVANTAQLFSLDPTVERTYFVREFSEALIQGYTDIVSGLNKSALEGITETLPEFYERRNRFLNHLMARFGEQFGEYTLLLTNLQGQQVALDRLIRDKISFLQAYPQISHDRGKAFNYKENPCSPENIPGIKKRVSLLLGYRDLTFSWTVASPVVDQYGVTFQLKDRHTNASVWMEGSITIRSQSPDNVTQKAFREIIVQMIQLDAYGIALESNKFRLKLKDKNGNLMGQYPVLCQTQAEAQAVRDELLGWSSNERAIVVEHLLLRPKFPGDALYPACTDGPCETCGTEDPYSFRLTFVMPGWTAPFNENLEMRDFADRTIRQEMPSHLLGKICWVGNDGFIENPCDPIIGELAELLVAKGLTAGGARPAETDACNCATAIYTAFSGRFAIWYADKTLDYIQPDALDAALKTEVLTKVIPSEIPCTAILDETVWPDVQSFMAKYFHHIALSGWQFERFEDAWCKWLEANAVFDWTEERLQERVEAILVSNLVASPVAGKNQEDALCKCATAILTKYGMAFYDWMNTNFIAGNTLENFTVFTADPVLLCPGFTFKPGTAATIEALLKHRYDDYRPVSYHLWIVVNLLSKLRNTYPGATLHDCDDGSDENPVRLGQTALGVYQPQRTVLPPDPSDAAPRFTRATESTTPMEKGPQKTKSRKSRKKR